MRRSRNQRHERHDPRTGQPRDNQGRFIDHDNRDRNWNSDYNENRNREYSWSDEDRRDRGRDDQQGYRSQYFGGHEDYPGPGRSQGFGTGRRHDVGDWGNSNFSQNTSAREHQRMHDRPYGQRTGYSHEHGYDIGEYGYGSGTTDMPSRGSRDQREDQSYNWGEHAGSSHTEGFRGKGPKGYKRSDERIHEEINERLTVDHELDASDIVISVREGEVSLTGVVSDRASKRRAEDIVEEISGVKNVENRIRVGRVAPEEPVNKEGKRETANGRTKILQDS